MSLLSLGPQGQGCPPSLLATPGVEQAEWLEGLRVLSVLREGAGKEFLPL